MKKQTLSLRLLLSMCLISIAHDGFCAGRGRRTSVINVPGLPSVEFEEEIEEEEVPPPPAEEEEEAPPYPIEGEEAPPPPPPSEEAAERIYLPPAIPSGVAQFTEGEQAPPPPPAEEVPVPAKRRKSVVFELSEGLAVPGEEGYIGQPEIAPSAAAPMPSPARPALPATPPPALPSLAIPAKPAAPAKASAARPPAKAAPAKIVLPPGAGRPVIKGKPATASAAQASRPATPAKVATPPAVSAPSAAPAPRPPVMPTSMPPAVSKKNIAAPTTRALQYIITVYEPLFTNMKQVDQAHIDTFFGMLLNIEESDNIDDIKFHIRQAVAWINAYITPNEDIKDEHKREQWATMLEQLNTLGKR